MFTTLLGWQALHRRQYGPPWCTTNMQNAYVLNLLLSTGKLRWELIRFKFSASTPKYVTVSWGPYVYASYLPLKINHYYASISSCRSGLGGAGNPRSNLSNAALASSAIAVYPSMMSTSANCRIFVMQNLPRAFSITRTLRCGMCIWCWLLGQAHG